jgi:sirohydrochlorin cobaltochelatase
MTNELKNIPMASAPFVYNDDGSVAWEKMWEGYCDLAIEGGPAHRDSLLKSKGTANNVADEKYIWAIDEILRALRLITPYRVEHAGPGWIRLQMKTGHKANLFKTVIEKENVEARQEGKILFVPVNDDFTLEKEIKNVVTVVGKAQHYWSRHRTWGEKFVIHLTGKDLHFNQV